MSVLNQRSLFGFFMLLAVIVSTSLLGWQAVSGDPAAPSRLGEPPSPRMALDEQFTPAVAFDGTNYLMVWQHSGCGTPGIYGMLIDADGSVLAPGIIAISTGPHDQWRPAVAFDETNYFIVWQDNRGGEWDIYGARVSTGGNVLDPMGIAISSASNDQSYPAVEFDDTNYLVVWEDSRDGGWDIYGSRVSVGGSVLDTEGIAIQAVAGSQREPVVAFDGTNYLVVWHDDRSGSSDIYGTRMSTAGSVLDSHIIVCSASYDQSAAAVTFDGTNYFAVWQDGRNGGNGFIDIYGARLSAAGTVLDPDGIAVSTAANNQNYPAVACIDSTYFVVWQDDRSGGGSSSDVYGARVGGDGAVLDLSGITISAAADTQWWAAVAAGLSDYLVAWQDRRSGSWEVYRSEVTSEGTVVNPEGTGLPAISCYIEQTSGLEGTVHRLDWVTALDPDTAWVVGGTGATRSVILWTSDGGNIWSEQTSPNSQHLHSLVAVDTDSAWAVGNDGTVIKTTDGGANWLLKPSGVTADLSCITIASPETLWAVGTGGTVIKTTDGGETWTSQTVSGGNLHGIAAVNGNSAYITCDNGVFKTVDGGQSWTQESLSGAYKSTDVLDANTIWAVALHDSVAISTDGGNSWSTSLTYQGGYQYRIAVASAEVAWIVAAGGIVLRTTDGGVTWSCVTSGTTNDLFGVATVGASAEWVTGDSGTILHSSAPGCAVEPTSLDFGTIPVGSSDDRDFTIKNSGCSVLSGTVSESCPHFSVISGSGPYTLATGDSVIVTVRYEPASIGTHMCTIETGDALCSDVSCVGDTPGCSVQPTTLDFGTVHVGSAQDTTFTIKNIGAGTLEGAVSESCPQFDLISGGGPYSIAPSESIVVTVRYEPTAIGTHMCTIETGHAVCADVACVGGAPGCLVTPDSLDFGSVPVGGFKERAFDFKNTGGGTLIGTVSENCPNFNVVSGGGPYALAAGESLRVVIRFEPDAEGAYNCKVQLNDPACNEVPLTGRGGTDPLISSIVDIGNDQGGQVRIVFQRASIDTVGATAPVLQYEAYRRIDPLPVTGMATASEASALHRKSTNLVRGKNDEGAALDAAHMLEGWDYVGAVPAHGEAEYSMIVETLADSTIAQGLYWSVFFIRAAASIPTVFYDSPPDSGYSLDNLAPCAPSALSLSEPPIILSWNEVPEEDFNYYSVYGSDGLSMDGSETLIGHTTDTWMDVMWEYYGYYHVTATDFSGNEGEASSIENTIASGPGRPRSLLYRLYQNAPNPFPAGGSTKVLYSVAEAGEAEIRILDSAGRLVDRILDRAELGENSVVWDGKYPNGKTVPPGVYFYELTVGAFRSSKKMLVVR